MHATDLDKLDDVQAAVRRLRRGNFSDVAPAFGDGPPERADAPLVAWIEAGAFPNDPALMAEALTCACWLGRTGVAAYLLDRGVDPAAGKQHGDGRTELGGEPGPSGVSAAPARARRAA